MTASSRFAVGVATAAVGLVVACALFHGWRSPTFVLTSIGGKPPLAPLYASLAPVFRPAGALAVLVLAAGLWLQRSGARGVVFVLLAVLFAFAFRVSVHAVRDPSLPGRELAKYRGEAVLYDVAKIRSAPAFLDRYAELQPGLSLHGRTKPPGGALLLWAARRTLGGELTTLGLLFTLVSSAVVVPAWLIGRHLGGPAAARSAALLVAVSPSSVLFGAVTLDAVFAVIAGAALALALAESAAPRRLWRVLLGGVLSLAAMFSYSTALVGLLVAALLVLRADWPWALRGRCLAEVGVAFLLPLAALAVLSGFEPLQTFANARALNQKAMTGIIGRDLGSFSVWSYASLGNALAFFSMLGVPIVAGLMGLRSDSLRGRARALAAGFVVTLATACLGGFYTMETERILLYLGPPAVALAAISPGFDTRAAVLLCGLQALVFEALFDTLW